MLDHGVAYDPISEGRRNLQTHTTKREIVFARCWMTALLTLEITSPLILVSKAFRRSPSKPLSIPNEPVKPQLWFIAWLWKILLSAEDRTPNNPPRKPSMPVRDPFKGGEGLLVHVWPFLKEDAIYIRKYAVLEPSSTTNPAKRVALRLSLGEVQLRAWSGSLSSRHLYAGS